jgi:programmed cell death protein 4
MASFAQRSEITISTMGNVHNPTGGGVAAVSSIAKAKASKVATKLASPPTSPGLRPASRSRGNSLGQDPVLLDDAGVSGEPVKRAAKAKKNPFAIENSHKKQGGLGKGKWNNDMTTESVPAIDRNDPNYDSEEDDGKYILVSESSAVGSPSRHSYDPQLKRVIYGPSLTLSEFKLQLHAALEELFESEDIGECRRILKSLDCKDFHFEIIKRAISTSFDRGDRERELVSRLLSESYPDLITTNDVGKGFERLFENLAEYQVRRELQDERCFYSTRALTLSSLSHTLSFPSSTAPAPPPT